MPLNFDGKVSVMDIFAIGIGAATALSVFFGVSTDVSENAIEIAHNRANLTRIERTAKENDSQILEQLRENKQAVKEIRTESAAGRKDILDKLDKLIERELSGN